MPMVGALLFPFPSSAESGLEGAALQRGCAVGLKQSRTTCSHLSHMALLEFPESLFAFSAAAASWAGGFAKRCPGLPAQQHLQLFSPSVSDADSSALWKEFILLWESEVNGKAGERKSVHQIFTKRCNLSVTGEEGNKGHEELVSCLCALVLFVCLNVQVLFPIVWRSRMYLQAVLEFSCFQASIRSHDVLEIKIFCSKPLRLFLRLGPSVLLCRWDEAAHLIPESLFVFVLSTQTVLQNMNVC